MRLMSKPRYFGAIEGIPEGTSFADRRELFDANIHRALQAGITRIGNEGADSIVLSGGYEDDHDEGDVIVYTGQGGRDLNSKKQIADQELTEGNLALAISHRDGRPVRVTRGSRHHSAFSPAAGYQYAGLYRVEDHWQEKGRSGFKIWRFRLVKIGSEQNTQPITAEEPATIATTNDPAKRKAVVVQRIVRDTAAARAVKVKHDYTCQVCGTRIETSEGPYAEAAHIRPLGRPHDGPDVAENILCLCPNHHVMFDHGGFSIQEGF